MALAGWCLGASKRPAGLVPFHDLDVGTMAKLGLCKVPQAVHLGSVSFLYVC